MMKTLTFSLLAVAMALVVSRSESARAQVGPTPGVAPTWPAKEGHNARRPVLPSSTPQASPVPAALVVVEVPDPTAELWFNDVMESQPGVKRSFRTPPLDPAKEYAYDVRASWLEDGQLVTRVKRVRFSAGEQVAVSFGKEEAEMREAELPIPPRRQRVLRPELEDGAGAVATEPDYLEARSDLRQPQPRLGGPLQVRITTGAGPARIAFPEPGGEARDGSFTLEAIDATATDAALSDDSVVFEAHWRDESGANYSVRCRDVLPRSAEHPVFGGVATNHLVGDLALGDASRVPIVFAYLAFWGEGELLKDGEILEESIPVHGRLSESARTAVDRLAGDDFEAPATRSFHLIVGPGPRSEIAARSWPGAVGTDSPPRDDVEPPVLHVVFENPQVATSPAAAPSQPAPSQPNATQPNATQPSPTQPDAALPPLPSPAQPARQPVPSRPGSSAPLLR